MRICVWALWEISGDNWQGLTCLLFWRWETHLLLSRCEEASRSQVTWKITCSVGASSAWSVCRTMGLNWSGPAALWGFRDLSSFSMPFQRSVFEAFDYGLDWKSKLHPWSFSSRSFSWAKELKRSWDLGLKTGWNCLFRAFDFSQSSERVLLSDFNGASPLESCFECSSSEYVFLVFTLGGLFSSCSVKVFIPRILPR